MIPKQTPEEIATSIVKNLCVSMTLSQVKTYLREVLSSVLSEERQALEAAQKKLDDQIEEASNFEMDLFSANKEIERLKAALNRAAENIMGQQNEIERLRRDNEIIRAANNCNNNCNKELLTLTAENTVLREALKDYEWLISELQMFKNRPEMHRALERIEKTLSSPPSEALSVVKEVVGALESISNELGVPQPGYPAPVANAYSLAKEALAHLEKVFGRVDQ